MRERILCLLLMAAAVGGAAAQAPHPRPAGASALPIRINEVNYEVRWVEIFNGNDQRINVASYWLCTSPVCAQLRSLRVRSGRTAMAPATFLVVDWDANRNADGDPESPDGEVGLFVSRPSDDAGNLLSYVAFGAAQHDGLDSVATAAGRWQTGAAAAAVPAGATLSFFGDGATPAADWGAGTPTPGEFNAQIRTGVEAHGETHDAFALQAYPNPFHAGLRVRLTVAQPQRVRLAVYDLLGRRVAVLHDAVLPAQTPRAFSFEAGRLPGGRYLIRVAGERFSATRTVTLLK